MSQIETENLTVVYSGKKKTDAATVALDGFSAVFESKAFNVIVGYSGCGKTTLLKAIAGLIPDYDGVIYYDNEDIISFSTQQRNLAFVSQDFVLYPHLTVFDNIAFPLKLEKLSRAEMTERIINAATALDLKPCLTRKPKHISIGQQQRVAIARALVKRPRICLMDEPLSNVDEKKRAEIRVTLKKAFKSFGCTVIYVTHDFSEAMALAGKLFVMNGGKLVLSGAPLDVYNSGDPVVKELSQP